MQGIWNEVFSEGNGAIEDWEGAEAKGPKWRRFIFRCVFAGRNLLFLQTEKDIHRPALALRTSG